MLSKHDKQSRDQMEVISLDDLVPRDHLVRKIEEAICISQVKSDPLRNLILIHLMGF